MSFPQSRAERALLLGWAGFAATMALLPLARPGHGRDAIAMIVLSVLLGGWFAWRRSRVAAAVTAVVAALLALSHLAYSVAGLGKDSVEADVVALDVSGFGFTSLAAGGAVAVLVGRRRAGRAGREGAQDRERTAAGR